jgi:hypothetical protein
VAVELSYEINKKHFKKHFSNQIYTFHRQLGSKQSICWTPIEKKKGKCLVVAESLLRV